MNETGDAEGFSVHLNQVTGVLYFAVWCMRLFCFCWLWFIHGKD